MPQMSPMLWSLLFIYFILLFLIFNILNYFNFIPNPMYNKTNQEQDTNNSTTKNSLIWKW